MSRIDEMLRLEARAAVEREIGPMGLQGLIEAVGRFFGETNASGDILTAAHGAIYLKRCSAAILAKIAPDAEPEAPTAAVTAPAAKPGPVLSPEAAEVFAKAQEAGKILFERQMQESRASLSAVVSEMVEAPPAFSGVGKPTNPPRIAVKPEAPPAHPAMGDPDTPIDFFSTSNEQLDELN